ncbi:MAG TPA: hypothetical protein EYQ81_02850 [Sneathiellales bacterium]|nr:hypothetical protein [Sneathiellales bacterium]
MPQHQFNRRINDEARAPVLPQVSVAAEALRTRIGDSVAAVLFYGSALREGNSDGKIIDLYVLVDCYRSAYKGVIPAIANAILPPNVYYLEIENNGNTVRIKYAVISLSGFEKQAAGRAFTPCIWGRFAQPTAVVYARNEDVQARVVEAMGQAVLSLIRKTVPLMLPGFGATDLWPRALRESYRTELRAEQKTKTQELYLASQPRFDQLLSIAAGLDLGYRPGREEGTYTPTTAKANAMAHQLLWAARRPVGKTLSVLRLLKAAFTFANGVAYILWKVERHSGVKITPTAWQSRHPLLAAVTLSWRLYIKGGFR